MAKNHVTDDESRLLDMVRASGRSVAVYDVSTPAILAVSERAREQLGFVDVELAAVDLVDRARDPDGVRKLLSLICDGQLNVWKFRSWLRDPDGDGFWDFGTGQAIDVGGRRLGLVTYPSAPPPASKSAGRPFSEDSIAELEERLERIGREVHAAGTSAFLPRGPMPPETLDLEKFSPRELEVITRMLRGERVPTIAKRLHLSASTVRNYLSRIYQKVGVHSQVELLEALQGAHDRGLDPTDGPSSDARSATSGAGMTPDRALDRHTTSGR